MNHCSLLKLVTMVSVCSDNSVPASFASTYQRVYLTAGTAYTFSGYVDTSEVSSFGKDGGVYLRFMNSTGTELVASRRADYVTQDDIAGGWTRLEVSYIPNTTGWYRVGVILKNAAGSIYADDFQLEAQTVWSTDANEQQCAGASSYNLLQIGSFELWNGTTADRDQDPVYWTYDATKATPSADGAYGDEGFSMYIPGVLTEKRRASQTVPLVCPGTTTFILSGWGKASAIMDDNPDTAITGDNDTGERFFGLIAKLTYSDGSTEYHYVQFDTLYTDWQYASGFVVPKETTKVVTSITVSTAYDYNANYARFDNILLTQEPAQTYTYDEEGNLKTVIDAATGEEAYTYEGANLTEYISSGSGTYQYDYDENNNLTKAWSDGVGTNTTYDSAGNTTGTKLSEVDEDGNVVTGNLYLQSSAEYTSDGNYVESITDVNRRTVHYTYSAIGHLLTTTVDKITDELVTTRTYLPNSDRLSETTMENWATVKNSYTRGMLSEVTRKAYLNGGTAADAIWQKYVMTYDKWGNVTEIKVKGSSGTTASTPTSWYTGITLGKYTYSGENGVLEKMEYGNGTYITYEYDIYGRQTRVKHWDASDTLVSQEHYFYNGNGDVSRMEHLDGAGKLLEAYIYEYDSLGRLIRSQLEDDASLQLKTEHIYDASNRLSRQNYYIDGVDFTEEFVYNEKDGSLSQMTTANGDTLTYSYDSIKRLWKVNAANEDGKLYTKEYEYFHYDGTSEGALATNEITELSYSGIGKGAVFNYDYDYLGNITSYSHGNTKATYDYDDLGQLISVTDDGVTTTYTYDTAGNIRQVSQDGTVVDTYTYGNNNWKDLLTAFNGGKIAYEGQTFNTTTGAVTGTPTSGNPISYFNGTRWNFTWANGRQLMSASTTDSTGLVDTEISYTYDLNGLRNSKTVITNTYAIVQHTVTFVADGVTVKTMTVDDGYVLKDSDYPAVPKKAGYHGNWNKYTGPITGDITIQASYHVPYSCTVTFRADNVIVKVMTVQDGYVLNATDYPSVPKKANYTGVWDVYNGPITTDVTINAIYIPNDSQIPVPTLPPDLEIMSADDEEAASATEASASATSSPSLHLTDTVTEQHDYIYASGRLLREVITTTDAEGNVTTQTLEFTYDGNG